MLTVSENIPGKIVRLDVVRGDRDQLYRLVTVRTERLLPYSFGDDILLSNPPEESK